jgi:hypothetical protein
VDDRQYRGGGGGEDGGRKGVHAVILDVDQRCAQCLSAEMLCSL